jgi:hypothetical protein
MKVQHKYLLVILFICSLFILYYWNYKESFILDSITSNKNQREQILEKATNLSNNSSIKANLGTDNEDILNRYINEHLIKNKTQTVNYDNMSSLNNDTVKALQLIELNELKLILKRIYQIESLPLQK